MKKQLKKHLIRFLILLLIAIFGGLKCDEYFQTSFPFITVAFVVMVVLMYFQVSKNEGEE